MIKSILWFLFLFFSISFSSVSKWWWMSKCSEIVYNLIHFIYEEKSPNAPSFLNSRRWIVNDRSYRELVLLKTSQYIPLHIYRSRNTWTNFITNQNKWILNAPERIRTEIYRIIGEQDFFKIKANCIIVEFAGSEFPW